MSRRHKRALEDWAGGIAVFIIVCAAIAFLLIGGAVVVGWAERAYCWANPDGYNCIPWRQR